jgi:hypothetical protein
MHCIPGKDGSPRLILIKFLRIDTMIALLSKKREINEPLKVKIGNNITKLNQGLLHILYLLVYTKNIISDWFLFNGHVFGTDENGTRHIFEIMYV